MPIVTNIIEKIDALQQTFKAAKQFAEEEDDLEKIVTYLESFPKEFLSIAYEATAMALGLKDLSKGEELTCWTNFMTNFASAHAVQVHVGLGWAMAQQRMNALPFLEKFEPMLRWRVIDGYGYYDGFFRRRKALQGNWPTWLTEPAKSVYLQGLGRSLWYSSKGNLEKLATFLCLLDEDFYKDLWRGIGIASAYVGGVDEGFLEKLNQAAGLFQPQLATGVALAIKSRNEADTIGEVCPVFAEVCCNMTIAEIIKLVEYEKKIIQNPNEAYHYWIASMETYLAKKSNVEK